MGKLSFSTFPVDGVTVLKVFGLCTTVPAVHSILKISQPQVDTSRSRIICQDKRMIPGGTSINLTLLKGSIKRICGED